MKPDVPVLSFEHLDIGYGHHIVARDLHGQLMAGTVTALAGTNGAGKSTLLRTLAALQRPLGGHIRYGDRDAANMDRQAMARTVSVVLTARPPAGGLTVREVAELGRTPYTGFTGRLTHRDRDIANRALTLVGAAALADRPLASLSDGERQRVMVAKALAQQTPAILLDEPTAFLDFGSKAAMLRLLCRLAREEGKAVLLSTHDLELAFRLVGNLWLLAPTGFTSGPVSALAADGTIAALFDAPGVRFDPTTRRFDIDA